MNKRALLYFIISIVIASCTPKPEIQVYDSLEIGLGKRYSNYVSKLNFSVVGDTVALYEFLTYKDLYDGAAYDHGWVLIELMRELGDEAFANELSKMNVEAISTLKMYFSGGLDVHKQANELLKKYPNSFKVLGIESE